MSFISYAQNFEDVILWRALGHIKEGRYLDIGAQDPVIDSVSLAFYNAQWRGIHVEATPFYAERLRNARPEEQVIEAAVCDKPGPIEFYQIDETGLSTGKESVASHHRDLGFSVSKTLVPTIRLDQLLELNEDDHHWLKIDVEGMEADVLRSWGESSRRPWVLVIESTFPSTTRQTHHQWIELVSSRGYEEVHYDGLSRYFIHNSHAELREKFHASANVFDQFSVTEHHFSATRLRDQIEQQGQALRDREAEMLELNEELIAAAQRHSSDWQRRESDLLHEHEKHLIEIQATERRQVEQNWLAKVRELEDSLNETRMAAGSAAAEAKAEIALLQERAAEIQNQLARSDAKLIEAGEKLLKAESEARNLTRNFDEMREIAATAGVERDAARSETEASRKDADEVQAKLTGQIENLKSRLRDVAELIEAAGEDKPTWLRRIGQAFGLVGQSTAWQRLAAWSPEVDESKSHPRPLSQLPDNEEDCPMFGSAPHGARNPYLRANSLRELLAWHDADFIRCAYVTVLGRQPDRNGEIYYIDRIRQGHSKLELLWQLRNSSEAKLHDPGITGLDRALKKASLERKPIVGPVVRLVTRGEGNSSSQFRLRRLENVVEQLRPSVENPDTSDGIRASISKHRNRVDLPSTNPEVQGEVVPPTPRVGLQPTRELSGQENRVFRQLKYQI